MMTQEVYSYVANEILNIVERKLDQMPYHEPRSVCLLIFTTRNEVGAKVMFLHVRVPTRTGKPGKMGRHFPVREF